MANNDNSAVNQPDDDGPSPTFASLMFSFVISSMIGAIIMSSPFLKYMMLLGGTVAAYFFMREFLKLILEK